jgi:UDP-N-acetylmuramate dehydrogenase
MQSGGCKEVFLKKGALFCDGGAVKFDEPMRAHTSLQVGGPAAVFAKPKDTAQLREILAFANSEGLPALYLGGGTNLLVTDEALDAVVISTAHFRGIELLKTESGAAVLKAQSGEALKGLLSYCQRAGLTGLEGLSGIPGSVGGAIKGNSGSYGAEIKDLLIKVEMLSADGALKTLSKEEVGFRYRGTGLKDSDLILNGDFLLKEDDPERVRFKMNEYFALKKKTQPIEARSAGCVFKNPPGELAGKLIEEAGLKGARAGDIEVSPVHANFFINKGKGTARDFMDLMERVADRIFTRTGIRLEPEIRIIRNAVNR